jgi:hypothetical protein
MTAEFEERLTAVAHRIDAAMREDVAEIVRLRAALDEANTERQRLEVALRKVRSIGARSGTELNAMNKVFDVIDAALAGTENNGDTETIDCSMVGIDYTEDKPKQPYKPAIGDKVTTQHRATT